MKPDHEKLVIRLRSLADKMDGGEYIMSPTLMRETATTINTLAYDADVYLASRIASDLSDCLYKSVRRELAASGYEPHMQIVSPGDDPFQFVVQALDTPLLVTLDVLIRYRDK